MKIIFFLFAILLSMSSFAQSSDGPEEKYKPMKSPTARCQLSTWKLDKDGHEKPGKNGQAFDVTVEKELLTKVDDFELTAKVIKKCNTFIENMCGYDLYMKISKNEAQSVYRSGAGWEDNELPFENTLFLIAGDDVGGAVCRFYDFVGVKQKKQ